MVTPVMNASGTRRLRCLHLKVHGDGAGRGHVQGVHISRLQKCSDSWKSTEVLKMFFLSDCSPDVVSMPFLPISRQHSAQCVASKGVAESDQEIAPHNLFRQLPFKER